MFEAKESEIINKIDRMHRIMRTHNVFPVSAVDWYGLLNDGKIY